MSAVGTLFDCSFTTETGFSGNGKRSLWLNETVSRPSALHASINQTASSAARVAATCSTAAPFTVAVYAQPPCTCTSSATCSANPSLAAANAAPDGRENAGETSEAAENSVEKTDPCIRRRATALDRLHRRSGETVNAVEDEHRADRDADMVRSGPVENGNAQRNTKGRSEQERPQPAPLQRVSQFPDRDALHDETERDDQCCRLDWREDVQPNGGGDQSESKARHACHQRSGKGRGQINAKIHDRCVHRFANPRSAA